MVWAGLKLTTFSTAVKCSNHSAKVPLLSILVEFICTQIFGDLKALLTILASDLKQDLISLFICNQFELPSTNSEATVQHDQHDWNITDWCISRCPAEYIKMPRPLLIFSQSDCLIRIVAINLHTWWQTAQIQLIWIGTVCKGRVYRGSAGQRLNYNNFHLMYLVTIESLSYPSYWSDKIVLFLLILNAYSFVNIIIILSYLMTLKSLISLNCVF